MRSRLLALALLCAAVIYSGLWFIEASRARAMLTRYIGLLQTGGYGISTGKISVGGFPLAIRIEVPEVNVLGLPRLAGTRLAAPILIASSWPWDPLVWRISAPDGLSALLPVPERRVRLQLAKLRATAEIATDGGTRIETDADDCTINVDDVVDRVAAIFLSLSVPAKQASNPDTAALDFKLQLENLSLPQKVGPLGSTVGSLSVQGSVNGAVPNKPLAAALAGWRDNGGTIEIRSTAITWGKLSLTGDGTVALDRDMQPEAAFSATLRGWGAGLDALAASGSIKPEQANFLRLGLALFSHPGADGESELKAPVTI